MAVSANENGIKILANPDGLRLLRTFENLAFDASRASEAAKVITFTYRIFLNHINGTKGFHVVKMQPTVNPMSSAAASSAGLTERVASVVGLSAMVGITCLFSAATYPIMLCMIDLYIT